MYSRFNRRAPARRAIAIPSPRDPCGVGRVEIDLTQAAGGEDRFAGEMRPDLSASSVEQVRPDDRGRAVPIRQVRRVVRKREQVDGRRSQEPLDVRLAPQSLDERLLDRRAGLVLDVKNPGHGVRALESPMKAGPFSIEGHLELVDQEPIHQVRTLARQKENRLGRAETVARALDVVGEALGRVAGRAGDDAALSVIGVGLLGFGGARDERDARPGARGRERRRAAGHARAQDQDVGRVIGHAASISSAMSAAMTE